MEAFLNFLRDRISRIRETERTAYTLLHEKNDEAGYREAMRDKAWILAEMHAQAQPILADMSAARRMTVEDYLLRFSQSAQRSLELDSVFYMSALLYPEDHQTGRPNTLETWLAELESKA
jgi:hypothetical protein